MEKAHLAEKQMTFSTLNFIYEYGCEKENFVKCDDRSNETMELSKTD